MKLVFANNPLGTPEASPESAGWKTVTQDGDNAPGEGVSDKVDELKTIVLKPIRKKRRPTPQAGTELGLHRDFIKRTNYGGDPATYKQPYTSFNDESAREFYYAPGEAGLTGAAKKAPPIPEEVYSFLKNLEDPGSGSEQVGEFFVAYEVFTDVCWDGLDKTIDMQRLAKETIDNLTVDQGVSGKIHDSGWLRSGKYGQDDVVYAIWWIPQDVNIEAAKPNMTWEERRDAEKAAREKAWVILNNDKADPKVVKRLCHAVDNAIRHRAAVHPNAPADELDRLSRSMDAGDREAVAENPSTSAEVLTRLVKTPYVSVQLAVATNPNAPAEALALLSKSKNKEIQSEVAGHPNTPADLVKFMQENSEDYQLKLLKKEDVSPEILEKLATKSMYENVREQAIRHPNMSSATLLKLVEGISADSSNAATVWPIIADSENITPEIAQKLNQYGDKGTRETLALNQKCPQEIIERMAEEIKSDIAEGVNYSQGANKRFRDAVVKRLPMAEQVALSSNPPKGVSKEPVQNVEKNRQVLRRLQQYMENTKKPKIVKQDFKSPELQGLDSRDAVKALLDANGGKFLTIEQVVAALGEKKGRDYYAHWGEYPHSQHDPKATVVLSGVSKTFALGFTDITGVSSETLRFLEEVGPMLQHSSHTIGVGSKNIGWILWQEISVNNQDAALIEQVQSDWRGLLPKLREEKEKNNAAGQLMEQFSEKYGGDAALDKIQAELDELVSDYPTILLTAFLTHFAGKKVYMTGKDRILEVTRMSPKTAVEIYSTTAKSLGFKESKDLPGYLEMVASLRSRLLFAVEDTLYQDDEAMAYGTGFPAPQGGSDVIEDTNLTPRQYPRPVRFGDKYRRLDYQKKGYPPTGIPEPLPTQTVQNDNMTYPLSSGLLFAAEDPSKLTWYFGAPEAGKTYNEGKSKLHSFTVAIYDTEESDKPVLNLTFYVKQTGNKLSIPKGDYDLSFFNQKEGEARFGVADLDRLGAGVEDSIFGQLPQDVVQQAKETVIPPTPEEQAKRDEKKAQQDKAQADKDTAAGAPQAQTEEAKAKAELAQAKVEHLKVKTEQEKAKTQETLRKAEEKKAKDAEKAADKATKDAEKAKEKAQTSTAPLPAQAKEAAPAVNIYEGYSKEVADELENIKKESPEEYAQALKEIGIEPPAAVPAEEGKADAVKEHAPDSPVPTEKKTEETEVIQVPDFTKLKKEDLGKYMFKENKELYEKSPEADQDRVMQLVQESIGNALEKKLTLDEVKRKLEEVVLATLAPIAKEGKEKKETPARPGYNVLDDPVLKEIAPKMDPEEKLFTGIKSWEDDLFSADPSKLDETTLALLDKKKQGAGQYFSWNYQSQDDVDEAQKKQEEEKGFTVDMKPTLVIKRLEPWKSIQDEVFKKRKASRGKK